MNKQREALKLALDALEDIFGKHKIDVTAINMLRKALAEPEKANQCGETCERAKLCAVCANGLAEQEQEPVAKVQVKTTGGNAGIATQIVEINNHLLERLQAGQLLYTTPPARKPLTEQQILELLPDAQHGWTTATYGKWVARAIERAHGIGGE